MGKVFRRYEEFLLSWIEEHYVKGYFFFNELVGGVVFKNLKTKDSYDDADGIISVSYTHLTLPTNREV